MENNKANMKLWEGFGPTDKKFTKEANVDGNKITSIPGMYMFQKATEAFGPWGIGWGVDVTEERYDTGGPLLMADSAGKVAMVVTNNGPMLEQHHVIKIELWYNNEGQRGTVTAYGSTKSLYSTNAGKIKSDGEAPKKSYTDAVKKALSHIGICSDIFLGLFDDQNYVAQSQAELSIKQAVESEESVEILISALIEKADKTVKTMETASTASELNGLFKSIFRDLDSNSKALHAKGQTEPAEKLNRVVKRIADVVGKRKAELEAAKARNKKGDDAATETQGASE